MASKGILAEDGSRESTAFSISSLKTDSWCASVDPAGNNMSFAFRFSVLVLASLCQHMSATPMPHSFAKTESPAVDYADVRARVQHAFPEKAHEMSAFISVLQTLSKETVALTETIHAHCGVKMDATPIARRTALRG